MKLSEWTVEQRLERLERIQERESADRAAARSQEYADRHEREMRNRSFAFGAGVATAVCLFVGAVLFPVLS